MGKVGLAVPSRSHKHRQPKFDPRIDAQKSILTLILTLTLTLTLNLTLTLTLTLTLALTLTPMYHALSYMKLPNRNPTPNAQLASSLPLMLNWRITTPNASLMLNRRHHYP